MCKSQNNFRYNKNKNNNNKNDKNNNNSKTSIIYQNNPLELTFGNSSFMSNIIQTETNNDFAKNKINKNKTFFKSINNNIHKKEKKIL